jgi:hypothetical protein
MSAAAHENNLFFRVTRGRNATELGLLSTEIDYAIFRTKLPHYGKIDGRI